MGSPFCKLAPTCNFHREEISILHHFYHKESIGGRKKPTQLALDGDSGDTLTVISCWNGGCLTCCAYAAAAYRLCCCPSIDQAAPAMASNLIPVRVDAKCNTGYRIVDTLLVDPTCLPRPLSEFRTANEAVEANVRILSDNLISDYEVAAIESAGYRHNYFSGRVALLNVPDLRGEVERQIRRALWDMVDSPCGARDGRKKRKTKSDANADGEREVKSDAGSKKQKVDEDGTADQDGDADDSNAEGDKATVGDGDDADATDDGVDAIDKSDLVKINIRIRDDKRKILVLDEFHVDPNCCLPGGDVVSVAKSLVKDLNLPADMELTIITTILEQIHGLEVPAALYKAKVNVRKDTGEIIKKEVDRETPSALRLS